MGGRIAYRCRLRAQQGVVVEDVDATTEGADHEILLAALDLEVAYGDGRKIAGECMPVLAAVLGEVHAELRTHEEQVRVDVVLHDRVRRAAGRQITADRLPGTPAVVAARYIGSEVALLVIVEDGIDHVLIVQRGDDVLDQRHVGDAAEVGCAAPACAAVFGHAHDPVIRAEVDQSLDEGALVQADGASVH